MRNLHNSNLFESGTSCYSARIFCKLESSSSWGLGRIKYEKQQFISSTSFTFRLLHLLPSRVGLYQLLVTTSRGATRILKFISALFVSLAVISCATVRKKDLDAWVGIPVEALDTHSFFMTVPVYRSLTASGIEIRNYSNGKEVAWCFSNANASGTNKYVNANAFTTCSSDRIVCNNIFHIKDGIVLEYAPTGRCYTDETVQPHSRYLQFKKNN